MIPNSNPASHIPVLLKETLEALRIQPGGRYVDCTVGAGGHAAAILEASSPGGRLLGIDADPFALEVARARLQSYQGSFLLVNDSFANLEALCLKYRFHPVDGILFDLGLSSLQLNGNNRGFSFQHDAPLDMRYDPRGELTADYIVNTYPAEELERLLATLGEERHSRQIARRLVQHRPIHTTLELAQQVMEATGGRRGRLHPATKTFLALRLAANQELENLEMAFKQPPNLLGSGGRLVVISYHSLEDRVVKGFLRRESRGCLCPPKTPVCACGHTPLFQLVNKKVIVPSSDEVKANPRARSARMRIAERL